MKYDDSHTYNRPSTPFGTTILELSTNDAMKVLAATLMVLGASIPVAMADFDIYFALAADWGNARGGWFFFDGEPDCDDV